MTLAIEAVPYGRQAAERLAALLREQRGADPLAPATVIVARSYVGLSLRRLLAGTHGLANVRFVTLPRLAAEIGTERLAGDHRPLTEVALRAACRAALREDAGILAGVRDHQSTEDALVEVWRALREASPAALDRIAGAGARQADVIRLARGITARLADHVDDRDHLEAAIARLADDATATSDLGPVIVHLPEPLLPGNEAFLTALATRSSLTVLLGTTGDPVVDADLADRATRLGAAPPAISSSPAPLGTAVWSAPSADVEVHAVVRDVSSRVAAGTPVDRIAITYGAAAPYALLLRSALDRAGLPLVATSSRRLAQTLPGRTLLGALALAPDGWRRADVVDWLASAQVRSAAPAPSASTVDHLSRRAGVTAGLDRWLAGLATLDAEARAELDDPAATLDELRQQRLRRRAGDATRLATFLADLAARIAPDPAPTTWTAWAAWAADLLGHLIGSASDREAWPTEEREAYDAIRQAIGALGGLDGLDPAPDGERFVRTLRVQLDGLAPQAARFGTGILVDPYRATVGLDLDIIYVLGVADGLVPGAVTDDALLPDPDRALASGEVPMLGERRAGQRRTWLAALAAAPERVLTVPRADQRTGRDQRPARWLLDALGSLAGSARQLYGRDLDQPEVRAAMRTLPSHLAAIREEGPGMPADPLDAELAALARHVAGGHVAGEHWLAARHPALGDAWQLRRDRRSGRYSRFEGRVSIDGLPSPADGSALSPTRLQTYATCPRRYLFEYVLGVVVPEVPGESIEAEATTVGSILHEVMERFIDEQTAMAPAARIRPGVAWGPDHHDRVQELASEVFDRYEALGLTGHPALWTVRSAAIRRDLTTVLHGDSERRAGAGAVPERAELSFGMGDRAPAVLALPDGRELRFKGYIDRVDRTHDGGALVIDYKTGSSFGAKDLPSDPVKRGQLLQLAIYGLAVQQVLGVAEVHAEYWYTSQKGRFERIGYPLDHARLERFRSVVHALVSGIEAGHFPARPVDAGGARPQDLCRWCDVAAACPSRARGRIWDQVRTEAVLAPLLAVIDHPWTPDHPDEGLA